MIAVDGDPYALALARGKTGSSAIAWQQGLAGALPFDDASVGVIVMSLLLHHLDAEAKRRALGDAIRVLRPGGRLHLAAWGRPGDPLMRAAFLALQLIDGFPGTRDHAAGRLPDFLSAAGFGNLECHARLRTAWGRLELIQADALTRRDWGLQGR